MPRFSATKRPAPSAPTHGSSAHRFHALNNNHDGLVTYADLTDGLSDHAVRLVHGVPAHGPHLPSGSAYGW